MIRLSIQQKHERNFPTITLWNRIAQLMKRRFFIVYEMVSREGIVARVVDFGSNLMLTKTCHFLVVRPLLIKQT